MIDLNPNLDLKVTIKDYLDFYPNTQSIQLAQYLKADYPDYNFRLTMKQLATVITLQKRVEKSKTPKHDPKQPFIIKSAEGYWTVVVGCTHIPFHNKDQWDATAHLTNWLSKRAITDIVMDGDILDMNSISRHGKGKVAKQPGLTLGKEYALASAEFDKIEFSQLRNKTYLFGNHENWYYVALAEVDMAKLGENALKSPIEGLQLKERGFNVLTNYGQDKHQIGDLLVVHGFLVNKHSSMAHLEVYKENVLFFHTHRQQTYTDSGPNNTQITAYNGGFGGDRHQVAFNYMDEGSKRKWKNGISVTYTNELGHTTVDLLDWKDGRFIFMGHQFTAEGVKSLI